MTVGVQFRLLRENGLFAENGRGEGRNVWPRLKFYSINFDYNYLKRMLFNLFE